MDPKKNRLALFTALILYVLTGPYYCWPILRIPILSALLGIIAAYAFYCNRRRCGELLIVIALYSISLLLFTITSSNILVFFAFLPFVFFLLGKDFFSSSVLNYYQSIFIPLLGLAICCWVLVLVGIMPSLGTISPLVDIKDHSYNVFLFCIQQNGFESIRFCGPFDEPGVVGTFSALLLCIRKFNLKSLGSIILLIGGILSLSLFFFLIIGVYGLFISIKSKNWITLLLISVVILVFYDKTKDDFVISQTLWSRFEWNSDTQRLAGDDRTNEAADDFYEKKKWTSEFWFGLNDYDSYWRLAEGSSSYKNIIMKNGVICFTLYLLPFIIIAYKRKRSLVDFALFLFIFISNVYQRTNLFDPPTMFLLAYLAYNFSIKRLYEHDNRSEYLGVTQLK